MTPEPIDVGEIWRARCEWNPSEGKTMHPELTPTDLADLDRADALDLVELDEMHQRWMNAIDSDGINVAYARLGDRLVEAYPALRVELDARRDRLRLAEAVCEAAGPEIEGSSIASVALHRAYSAWRNQIGSRGAT